MKAYKYFDSQFKERILGEGCFRIGTLYDYRDTEMHGAEVGDSNEGKVGANSYVMSWSSSNPVLAGEHPREFVGTLLDGYGVKLDPGSFIGIANGGFIALDGNSVGLNNVTLRSEFQVQNLYVFSFSLEADFKLMSKIGYDACYEIKDIESFLRALPCPNGAKFGGWSPVKYESKELQYERVRDTNPAFLKEPHFSYQRECRAIWLSGTDIVRPEFVVSKKAAELCSLVEVQS